MSNRQESATPDLTKGIPVRTVSGGGMVRGHVGDDEVVLAHVGDRVLRGWRPLHALSRDRSPTD